MAEMFRFAAFISYSSKDKAFARKLHRMLESYSIPKSIGTIDVIGGGKKNRIFPVFKDQEELPSGDLGQAIESALTASASLIVLCSKDSAQSKWVNKEIEFFKSIGRADRIFPVIVDTVDNGLDHWELCSQAMPEELKIGEEYLLAGDARKKRDGFKNAAIKAIAGIIGVNAGTLQNREKKRQLRRRVIVSGLGASICGLTAFGLWGYVLPHYSYANNYERVYNHIVPHGDVNKNDVLNRWSTYKFTSKGAMNPIFKVEEINWRNSCPENPSFRSITGDKFEFDCNFARACSKSLEFEGERVSSESVLDQYGNTLEKVIYREDDEKAIREEAVIGCSRVDNGIKFIELERVSEGPHKGKVSKKLFFWDKSTPRPNKSRDYGYEYSFGESDYNIVRLGSDGNPINYSNTVVKTKYKVDERGNKISMTTQDREGLAIHKNGFSSTRFLIDEYDNVIERSYYNKENKPVSNRGHASKHLYDLSNMSTVTTSLDIDGELMSGIATTINSYDENGYLKRKRFFDSDGQPVSSFQGVHEWRYTKSKFGELVEGRYFGEDGTPIAHTDGFHMFRNGASKTGDRLWFETYGSAEEKISPSKCFRTEHVWNEFGQRIGRKCFDEKGEPTRNKYGVFYSSRIYNSEGRFIRTEYFDEQLAPIEGNDGIHRIDYEYDTYGNKTSSRPFSLEGELLVLSPYNWGAKFDEFGRQIENWSWTQDGLISALNKNYAFRQHTYVDNSDKISTTKYLDEYKKPVLLDGVHKQVFIYNDNGHVSMKWNIDEAGNLAPDSKGVSVYTYLKNRHDQAVETSYLSKSFEPILNNDGYAEIKRTFDKWGNTTSQFFFGLENKPVTNKNGYHGWRKKYDELGNLIESSNIGVDGKPVPETETPAAIFKYKYNTKGQKIEESYFGINGEPVLAYKNHMWKYKYNSLGLKIRSEKFDTSGEYTSLDVPIHAYEYSSKGKLTKLIYKDTENQPTVRASQGAAYYEKTYDEYGRELSQFYMGLDGKPEPHYVGWHIKETEYFENGRKSHTICYTIDRTQVPCE